MSLKKSSNISNSTPSAATKKTASAPSFFAHHLYLAVGLFAVGALAAWLWPQPVAHVRVGGREFNVPVAANNATRQQGLSHVARLQPGSGMLFVFPTEARWQFWMKDMRSTIDIVWLNASQQVVHIVRGASPDSYPHVFTPSDAARYVLELPPGGAADVTYGDHVSF